MLHAIATDFSISLFVFLSIEKLMSVQIHVSYIDNNGHVYCIYFCWVKFAAIENFLGYLSLQKPNSALALTLSRMKYH